MNKLSRSLDTNTDVILDNNNFSSKSLTNNFFIEVGEKTDSLASIKLISQNNYAVLSIPKL